MVMAGRLPPLAALDAAFDSLVEATGLPRERLEAEITELSELLSAESVTVHVLASSPAFVEQMLGRIKREEIADV